MLVFAILIIIATGVWASRAGSAAKFDNYVRVLAKISTAISGLLAAVWLLVGCGGIAAGLLSIAQIPLLLVLLWIPLLWRRIKKLDLDANSANWALFASISVFAVLLLSMIFDRTGKYGCFR